jgi:hypothetical protein
MHDEPLDQPTAAFLDEVRAAFGEAAAPRPAPELAALFASGLTNDKGDLSVTAASNANGSAPQTSGLPNWTRRHIDMVKDVMEQVRTRAVAAAVGAGMVLSGLGASGALNAPLRMISDSTAPTEECATSPAPAGGTVEDPPGDTTAPPADSSVTDDSAGECTDGVDGTTDDSTGESVDGTTDDTADDTVEGTGDSTTDPTVSELPAAPTTVSEAAHIHDFDEACGNHGAYVSHFARFGEEPECATTARGSADPGTAQDVSAEPGPATDEQAVTDSGEDAGATDGAGRAKAGEPRTHGKGQSAHAGSTKGGRGKSHR